MSDQTLLIVPGLAPGLSSSRLLDQLQPFLPDGLAADGVDLLDLVRRACAADGSGTDALATALAAEMDDRGVTDAIIVAEGVSATAALRLAALRPELVRHLVLCAPFGYAQPLSGTWESRESVAARFRELYLGEESTSSAALEVLCGSPSLVPSGLSAAYRESGHDDQVAQAVGVLSDWMETGALNPMESPEGDRVRHSRVPVSLVWGRDDRACGLDAAFYLNRRLKDVQLRIFGDLGHLVLEQGGDRISRHIGAVLTQVLLGDTGDDAADQPSADDKVGSPA